MSRAARTKRARATPHAPAPPPPPAAIPRERLVMLFLGAALCLLTVLVYSPCLDHPFVDFDDADYVTQNRHVRAGLSAEGVRWAFTTFDCGNWHPLTWLSLQLDSTLYGGLKPGGFHLTNILLHAANTLLLFLILRRATGAVWRSAVVAALFALHPLNVEPVAWVAERKGLLSTFFWMLALAAYLFYVHRPGVLRYLPVALALVLGLMAKPLLLTLPFVSLLLDWWPLNRWRSGAVSPRRLLLEKVPLLAVVLAWCVLAFVAQRHVGALPSLESYPWDVRLWNALLSYVAYLGKALWPSGLAAHYPHPGSAVSVVRALAAGLILVLITALVLGPGRRRPYLAVGWLWYLATLVPMIGLVQIGSQGMADRYTYVPLVGVFLALTWGVADLFAARHRPRAIPIAAAATALIACTALTWTQVGYWKSDGDLWEHALAVTEKNALAHNNLGMHYYRQGMADRAAKEFKEAVAIDPHVSLFHDNRATLLHDFGHKDEAESEYRRAIELSPDTALYHIHLGNLLRDRGREPEALAELHRAADLEPESAAAHYNLGALLDDMGRTEEAVSEYRRAADLDAEYASPHVGLGNVLAGQGRFEEAQAEFRRAIDLNPAHAVAHRNLGLALQAAGRLDEAMDEYRTAVELGDRAGDTLARGCERLMALRPRLAALVAGREQPSDNKDRRAFAELCAQPFEGRYALASRLYDEAFRNDPALATDLRTTLHLEAASAAARAGCGQGRDAAGLDDAARARWRGQALSWLRSDLPLWAEPIHGNVAPAHAAARGRLRLWRRDAGLACVREPGALAKLPEAEREGWRRLWRDVAALVAGKD